MKVKSKYLLLLGLTLPGYAATLQNVVKETLESNPQMQKSISDYRAVEHDVDIAKGGYLPDIDLRAGIGREKTVQDDPNTVADPDLDVVLTRKESEVMLTENIFKGFGTQSDVKEQESRLLSARSYALQDANSIALRTVEVYVEVLRQKALLDLVDANVKTHERIYDMIFKKTVSGVGKRSDLEQTEGRVALAYANYIAQQNNYQDALVNFERVYGKLLSGADLEEPAVPAIPNLDLAQLEKLAHSYSPTLQILQSNIKALEAKTDKYKSSMYPTLDGELSAQWNEDIAGQEGRDDSYKAMLRLNYNLYNGGSDEALRLQNLQYVTSEKETLNAQQRAVLEKLKLAYMANQLTIRQLRCLKMHEQATAKTSDSYSREYQLGRRELLDLLNVELEHNTAMQEVAKAEYDLLYAKFRILEATGLLPYALNSGIEQRIEAEVPQDIVLMVQEEAPLTLEGEVGSFIDIDNVCRSFKVMKVIAPEPPKKEPIVLDVTMANKPLVMDNIYFKFNSSALTKEAKMAVKEYAKQLIKLDKDFELQITGPTGSASQENYELQITGHTDSTGPDKYNQWLSEKRAESVKNALVENGVNKDRITTSGMGEKAPIATNKTKEGRQQNRRIEFLLKM